MVGESVYNNKFLREFCHINGAVAMDLDERFSGWKLGLWSRWQLKRRKFGSCWMGWLFIDFLFDRL